MVHLLYLDPIQCEGHADRPRYSEMDVRKPLQSQCRPDAKGVGGGGGSVQRKARLHAGGSLQGGIGSMRFERWSL